MWPMTSVNSVGGQPFWIACSRTEFETTEEDERSGGRLSAESSCTIRATRSSWSGVNAFNSATRFSTDAIPLQYAKATPDQSTLPISPGYRLLFKAQRIVYRSAELLPGPE